MDELAHGGSSALSVQGPHEALQEHNQNRGEDTSNLLLTKVASDRTYTPALASPESRGVHALTIIARERDGRWAMHIFMMHQL